MGRKNFNSFIKHQKAEKKRKKKEAKREKIKDRKKQSSSNDLENMIAWVDDDGNITTETPEDSVELEEEIIKQEKEENEDNEDNKDKEGN